MKLRLISVVVAWSFVGLFLVSLSFSPSAMALPWNVAITPANGPAINAGELVTISMTGPDDSMVYVEIIDANTSVALFRFPSVGSEWITLTGGLAVVQWTIPNATYDNELFYIQMKDDSGATRDIKSFRIVAAIPGGEDPPDDATTLAELKLELERLQIWRSQFEKELDWFVAETAQQMNILMTFLFIAVIASLVAIVSAFSDRYPKIKAFFGGDKIREDKTEKRLMEYIEYFIMRDIPVDFRAAFAETVEEAKKVEEVPVEPEPELEPEEAKQSVFDDKTAKKSKFAKPKSKIYKRKCAFCGEPFTSKSKQALYCPDKGCRLLAFRERKRKREGKGGGDE